MGKLTAIAVKAATKAGRYGDGAGLHLLVKPNGSKSWVLRYAQQGRTRDMGLGPYPDVSLADARKAADDARAERRQGRDPIDARRIIEPEVEVRTFRAAAEGLIADRSSAWANAKHTWQWEQTLEAHAYPVIGAKPIGQVTTEDVMNVLRPIWPRIPETASRVRGRIEAVIDAARARGWFAGENPARWKGHLATRLPPPTKVRPVEHHPSLPYRQIGAFMEALRRQAGMTPLALEMLILTASRAGMVRGMTWGELDAGRMVWTVPGSRMKGKRPHRIPLSAGAMALLEAVRPDTVRKDALVFPGLSGKPLSLMSMTMLTRRMNGDRDEDAVATWLDDYTGEPIVPHGFRSTFRVWAGEQTPYPREVVEAALAHTIASKTEASYARTDLLEKRRPLMTDWSSACLSVVVGTTVAVGESLDESAQAVRHDQCHSAELLSSDAAVRDQGEQAGPPDTA